ncbi:MAG: 30S ribosomal protein S2 [Patescibacteria group bacterium]
MSAEVSVTTEPQILDPKLEGLLRAGVHFGYARTRRHPRMRSFIAGVKSNIEILHLQKVHDQLQRALEFAETLGREGGVILWVGTKPVATSPIARIATELGHPFVNKRWLGGTLTNNKNIRERVAHWQDLVFKQKSGELATKYTKQEQLMIQREIDRLDTSFNGLVAFTGTPQAMFIVDTKEEGNALHEARLKKISVIALLNTDCDPAGIQYAIPGNDNAARSVEFVMEEIKEAYLRGKQNKVQE